MGRLVPIVATWGSITLTAFSVYAGDLTGELGLVLVGPIGFGGAPAAGVAGDVGLALAGDAQRLGGDVLGDHRARAGVGVVADGNRGHEGHVHAGVHARADLGAVLGGAVVVGGDGAGPQVGVGADVGVAHVGQMRDLGPGADVRVLDLHEGAGLGALLELGPGAQVGEGAHRAAGPDPAGVQVGVHDAHLVGQLGVDQGGERPDAAQLARARRAAQEAGGLDDRVAPQLDVDLDHRAPGVDDGHPGGHVALVDAALGELADLGQRDAVVDAEGERRVVDLVRGGGLAVAAHDDQGVGEVVLALDVVGAHLGQSVEHGPALEGVDAGVDLFYGELPLAGIPRRLGLHHPLDRSVGGAHHASVAGGVVELHGGHRGRGAARLVALGQSLDRLRSEEHTSEL